MHYSLLHRLVKALLILVLIVEQTGVCEGSRDVGSCRTQLEKCQSKKWHHDAVCSAERRCVVADERKFSFLIKAKMRSMHKKKNLGGKKFGSLWMRGTGPGLSWDKPIELRRSAASMDTWKTTITYRTSSDALLCTSKDFCVFNQRAMEFRFSRDQQGKDDMMGPNFYFELPISRSMQGSPSFLTPSFTVYPWFDNREVKHRQFKVKNSLHSMGLLGSYTANLNILYPPSFEHNVKKTYPLVLYLGHSAKAFAPLLELAFTREALTREAVVVGVTPFNKKPPYLFLSPYLHSSMWYCRSTCKKSCPSCWVPRKREDSCNKNEFLQEVKKCLKLQKKEENYGDAFLNFIEMDVIPKIREKTHERVEVNFPRQRLSIFGEFDGSSLLACHAALTRPQFYQNAACFSAPFYWPITAKNYEKSKVRSVFKEIKKQFEAMPALNAAYLTQKYYVDISENEQAVLPVVDPYKHTHEFVKLLTKTLHLEEGKNILYFTVSNIAMAYTRRMSGSKATMMLYDRFLTALRFFLRAEGGPSRKAARVKTVTDKTIAEHSELYGGLVQPGGKNKSSSTTTPAKRGTCRAQTKRLVYSKPSEVPIFFFLPILGT